ncbi:MAG: hypothetical protein AAF715_20110 [Myxococcota bacterium]
MSERDGDEGKRGDNATAALDVSTIDWQALHGGGGQLPFKSGAAAAPPPSPSDAGSKPGGAGLPFGTDPLAATSSLGRPPPPSPTQRHTMAVFQAIPDQRRGGSPAAPPPATPGPPASSIPGYPRAPGADAAAAPASVPPASAMPVGRRSAPPPSMHPSAPPPPALRPSAPPPAMHPSAPPPAIRPSAPPPAEPRVVPAPPPPASGVSPWSGGGLGEARARPPLAVPIASPPAAKPAPLTAPAAAPAPAAEGLALVWAEPGGSLRLRRNPSFRPLIDALEDKPIDNELDGAGGETDDDGLSVEDRRETYEVLVTATPWDGPALRAVLTAARRSDGKFAAPLVMVRGRMVTPFLARPRLEVTLTTVQPFITPPEERIVGGSAEAPEKEEVFTPLSRAVRDAQAFLEEAGALCPESVLDGFTERVSAAFAAEDHPALPSEYLQDETERTLLRERAYATRKVFGDEQLLARMDIPAEEKPVPVYLPPDLAERLPLDASFSVRLIAEVHHRIDRDEASPFALRAVALGRVLPPWDG